MAKGKEEKLAVIKGVKCGVGDFNKFALWFGVYIDESNAALQVIEGGPAVAKFVEAYGVRDVHDLEGKPVWVDVDRGIKLLRPCVFK